MALTLSGIALGVARAGRAVEARGSRSALLGRLVRAARPAAGFAVVAAGLMLALRGAVAI